MSLESVLTFIDVLQKEVSILHISEDENFGEVSRKSQRLLNVHQVLHALQPQLLASPFFSPTPAASLVLHIGSLSLPAPLFDSLMQTTLEPC